MNRVFTALHIAAFVAIFACPHANAETIGPAQGVVLKPFVTPSVLKPFLVSSPSPKPVVAPKPQAKPSPDPKPAPKPKPAPSSQPRVQADRGDSREMIRKFHTDPTGYYPHKSSREGGFCDRTGRPLRTLEGYLSRNGDPGVVSRCQQQNRDKGAQTPAALDLDYVAIAMDEEVFPYGTELCIPSIDKLYGRKIRFLVVDTGGDFAEKGTRRIDICVKSKSATLDPSINIPLDAYVCNSRN